MTKPLTSAEALDTIQIIRGLERAIEVQKGNKTYAETANNVIFGLPRSEEKEVYEVIVKHLRDRVNTLKAGIRGRTMAP